MHPVRTATVAVLASVVLVVPVATSVAAPASPPSSGNRVETRAIGDCVHRRVEPRKVISACADSGEFAVITHYDGWHRRQATGSGRLVVNDCRPSCAAGTFHAYPATFRFHRVVRTSHGPLFSRLGVTYVKGGEQHDAQLFLPTRPL